MLDFSNAQFDQVVIHKVGNRSRNERLAIAAGTAYLNDEVKRLLAAYFLRSF